MKPDMAKKLIKNKSMENVGAQGTNPSGETQDRIPYEELKRVAINATEQLEQLRRQFYALQQKYNQALGQEFYAKMEYLFRIAENEKSAFPGEMQEKAIGIIHDAIFVIPEDPVEEAE